jgi:hypothetical protein
MSVKKFNIEDYENDVAYAITKLGGVEIAAEKLDTIWLEVQDWIRMGYVPPSYAKEIHNRIGVPMYDPVQRQRWCLK